MSHMDAHGHRWTEDSAGWTWLYETAAILVTLHKLGWVNMLEVVHLFSAVGFGAWRIILAVKLHVQV